MMGFTASEIFQTKATAVANSTQGRPSKSNSKSKRYHPTLCPVSNFTQFASGKEKPHWSWWVWPRQRP
ncbi:hypothetical protein WJX77_005669 [Trebouxia sp. C0004]